MAQVNIIEQDELLEIQNALQSAGVTVTDVDFQGTFTSGLPEEEKAEDVNTGVDDEVPAEAIFSEEQTVGGATFENEQTPEELSEEEIIARDNNIAAVRASNIASEKLGKDLEKVREERKETDRELTPEELQALQQEQIEILAKLEKEQEEKERMNELIRENGIAAIPGLIADDFKRENTGELSSPTAGEKQKSQEQDMKIT